MDCPKKQGGQTIQGVSKFVEMEVMGVNPNTSTSEQIICPH